MYGVGFVGRPCFESVIRIEGIVVLMTFIDFHYFSVLIAVTH